MDSARYIPALSYGFLTAWYDPVVRWTTREATFRAALLAQMSPGAGQRILDVGCGTGTFLLQLAEATRAELTGIDGDPRALELARAKSAALADRIKLHQGLAEQLPFPDRSFHQVSCSLFLHHLARPAKLAALVEMKRVLLPGGSLHVADWGKPSGMLMRLAFLNVQLLDGFETTRDHAAGVLPDLLKQAGFSSVQITKEFSTPCGTIALLRAAIPDSSP